MKAHLHYFLNLGVDLIPPRLTCQATYRPKKKRKKKERPPSTLLLLMEEQKKRKKDSEQSGIRTHADFSTST
jgi:hypothetical protein